MSLTEFPSRFGKYILLDRINSGGMAEVYRAKVSGVDGFERLVAIKSMLPALAEDQQFTTMFIDEAKLAAQLDHAGIVRIYELGRIGTRLYIAMELVSGRDLRHVIRTARAKGLPLPLPFAAYVVAAAAEALDFAHHKRGMDGRPMNLVHRDVSPQNILISYDGEVKVVDFGIAKAEARATETRAGMLKGKLAYMAPEQVAGGDVDRRADIFALGAVLYEVLSGERLFAGESDLSILDKVHRADVAPVEKLLESAHPSLRGIFARALARSRDERFAWASELVEQLEPLLIEKKSIFGAKRAGQIMRSLYAGEIALLGERLRQYAEVSDEEALAQSRPGSERSGQVFESTLAAALASEPARASDWGAGGDDATAALRAQTIEVAARAPAPEPLTADEPPAPEPAARQGLGHTGLLVAAAAALVLASTAVVMGVLAPVRAPAPAPALVAVAAPGVAPAAAPVVAPGAPAVTSAPPVRPATEATPAPSARPAPAAEPRYGFISVLAVGIAARVVLDGEEAGFSPLIGYRLKVGRHVVRIVEDGGQGRVHTEELTVSASDTKKTPKKLIVRW